MSFLADQENAAWRAKEKVAFLAKPLVGGGARGGGSGAPSPLMARRTKRTKTRGEPRASWETTEPRGGTVAEDHELRERRCMARPRENCCPRGAPGGRGSARGRVWRPLAINGKAQQKDQETRGEPRASWKTTEPRGGTVASANFKVRER